MTDAPELSDLPVQPARWFEDFKAGDVLHAGPETITLEAIKDFAAQWDPQPFHIDEEAARDSFFEGIAASGWHTACLTMRLMVAAVNVAGGLIGASVEDLRWPRPTRPGDQLRVEVEVLETRVLRSRPAYGMVRVRTTTFNSNGEIAQQITTSTLAARRNP